jgi:NitT/TauT family transport system permease protein
VGERTRQSLWPVVSFLTVLAVWQTIVSVLAPPPFLLPSPGRVLVRLIEFGPDWPRHIFATVEAIVLGFVVAVAFGATGALAVVASDRFRQALTPLLITLQIIPKIAFAPLILVWFGLGIVSKMTVAFLVAFFPVLINTAVGLVQIEPELLDLTRAIKARRSWVFLRVRLPNSLPYFFAGLRIASTLAVIGAVIAEFVGSDVGLGYLIVVANNQLDTPLALASIALVSILGLTLYGLLVAVERLVTPWARVDGGLKAGL